MKQNPTREEPDAVWSLSISKRNAARLNVVDASDRFKPRGLSTLSISWGDGEMSQRVEIRPEHRREIAFWLTNLARRIGAPD